MNFKSNQNSKGYEKLGFIVMYFIFTIVLYLILKFLNKLPENWGIFHIIILTLIIVLVGTILRKLLK